MAFLTEAANRGSISTGYDIDNSCVFVDTDRSSTGNGANSHLHFTPSSTGNRKVGTFSAWVKRSHIDSLDAIFSSGQNDQHFRFQTTGINIRDYNESTQLQTNAIYRDTAAFYHFVMAVDTTQGTAANRLKLYINGEQITSFSTETYPTQNQDWNFNYTGNKMFIGARRWHNDDVIQGLDGYMADVYWIDGTQKAPTDFGEYDEDSGIWKPKAYSGTFGTNGCYLKFDNASDLGEDSSGNGNDWTKVNIAAANQATDTPTNNFCTINTPFQPYVGSSPTISNGATVMTGGASGQQDSYGTMALFKGKWYFEFSVLNVGGLAIYNMYGGVVKVNRLLQSSYNNAANGHHSHDGGWGGNAYAVGYHAGSSSGFTSVSGAAVDTVIGVAVDMDNGKIWWSSQGTYASSSGSVSNPATATLPQFTNLLTQYPGEPVVPALNSYIHQSSTQTAFNFGGHQDHAFTDIGTNSDANGYGSFAYTPPSGYYAICSKNLAEYG